MALRTRRGSAGPRGLNYVEVYESRDPDLPLGRIAWLIVDEELEVRGLYLADPRPDGTTRLLGEAFRAIVVAEGYATLDDGFVFAGDRAGEDDQGRPVDAHVFRWGRVRGLPTKDGAIEASRSLVEREHPTDEVPLRLESDR